MSDAIVVQGTKIEVGLGTSPETYVEVKEARDFDGPGGESPRIDVSHMQSTQREYKTGLADPGDMSFNCNLITTDPGQNRLISLQLSRLEANFRVTYSNAATRTFAGLVQRFRETGARDDVVQVAVALQVTGAIARA